MEMQALQFMRISFFGKIAFSFQLIFLMAISNVDAKSIGEIGSSFITPLHKSIISLILSVLTLAIDDWYQFP